ncbi:hypothetical protein Y032_0179g732 [Ancylostoma ceylanicum]|uniref:Uncharacterized protein n=1 Tax=Ancylostoma ceylanicum TaxID=53326 RepID=A0A016SSR2_9BILA|nr:hypothetical protein Y032_0179g732 [Ancylostoma ceylanicum]
MTLPSFIIRHALLLLVLSVLKNLCGILQSVVTTPSLYSNLILVAMRTLPERMSPASDPVTMWTREEVLKRHQMRKEKGRMEEAVQKIGGRDCHTQLSPWTPSFEKVGCFPQRRKCFGEVFNKRYER